MQASKSTKSLLWLVAKLLALLAVVWLCAILGPLSYFLPFLAIGALVHLLRRRHWVAATVYIVLLPTMLVFLAGVVSYVRGRATLLYVGLPGTTSLNLDRELRCCRGTLGDVVRGNEWIGQFPNNGAVRLLIAVFDYMPGTYTGPYPTEGQAITAVNQGVPISADDLAADQVIIGDDTLRLDEGVGRRLLASSHFPMKSSDIPAGKERIMPTIRAAVWQNECVLLRIPFDPLYQQSDSAMVVVLSKKHGRPFAYYGIGEYHHNYPPVPWQAEE